MEYKVVYSKRKSLAIHITRDGFVEVRAPKGLQRKQIEAFVAEKKPWIIEKKAMLMQCKKEQEAIAPIAVEQYNRYCDEIEAKLRKLVPVYAAKIGVTPKKITIKAQKTRWGSCSSSGNININWRLAMTTDDVLEYVLVHELCHLRHMNHSKTFWDLVATVNPQYLKCRKWLKENGHLIMAVAVEM